MPDVKLNIQIGKLVLFNNFISDVFHDYQCRKVHNKLKQTFQMLTTTKQKPHSEYIGH